MCYNDFETWQRQSESDHYQGIQIRFTRHHLKGFLCTMKSNFPKSLEHVLIHEGGYVDHPSDPGGPTNKGITLRVFQRTYGKDYTREDLKAITDEQVSHIYFTEYWRACRCDDLPDGIDYVVFDQAVNSGPGRSARWLQATADVTVDGRIGPQSVAATKSEEADRLIDGMCDCRLDFMKGLSTWADFGRGWQARVDGVRDFGLRLANGQDIPVPLISETASQIVPSTPFEAVRKGSRGEWVIRLQEALGVETDGVFGSGTDTALKNYQEESGLVPDGIAGRNTYRSLGLIT